MSMDKVKGCKRGNPERVGAEILPGGLNFSFNIPDEEKAELVLTDAAGKNIISEIELPPEERTGDVSAVFVETEDADKIGYYYRVGGKKQLDPFARRISKGICFPAADEFDWAGDKPPDIPFSELNIYKCHVRGFTKQTNSGVKEKGTFLGAVQKIPYIQELGFNAVEFMPMYEWDDEIKVQSLMMAHTVRNRPEMPRNYWGYAVNNYYFAPKQAFSHAEDSVNEVKTMVRSFHEAGIECIMEFYVPKEADTASVIRAVRFWKIEYHIDGFHFVGSSVPMSLLVRDPLLSRTKMFFEKVDAGWLFGSGIPKFRNIIEYNDAFLVTVRQFLKGDEGQTEGFENVIRRNPPTNGIVNYAANTNGFTLMDAVSYDWKHNEENGEDNSDGTAFNYSWNCGVEGATRKSAVMQLRKKQIRNALSYVFLSAGIPLLLAGDEFGNSQGGNNNAYSCDNAVGWVDWNEMRKNSDLTDFLRKLTAFRKRHPILHGAKELRGTDYRSYGFPDISFHDTKAWFCPNDRHSRSIAAMYCGLYAKREDGSADDFIYIAFNAHWEKHSFALPTLPHGMGWFRAMETDAKPGEEFTQGADEDLIPDQREYILAPRSVGVLTGKLAGDLLKKNEHHRTSEDDNKTS